VDRKKPREAEQRDGHYLLRSNLTAEDPAVLWTRYIHSRVEIETVAVRPQRQPFQFPTLQRLEQALYVAHGEASEQVADGVVRRKALHTQQGVQRLIATQPDRVNEASRAWQD
jgi:hypothetical protein